MPAFQSRQAPTNLRKVAQKQRDIDAHPMVKSNSQSSDDEMDLQTPKQLHIPSTAQMPARYESDEESASPCPDDFEDAQTSFSDVEFDSTLDFDDDESPFIADAVSMPIKAARPLLVNISNFAPMEKRSTAAHVRPQVASKVSLNRPVVARAVNNGPNLVTLGKPPSRKAVPPPVPARSEARTPVNASAPVVAVQRPYFPPRKDSHASRPSISTVASNFDDDRSSIADSSTDSSAPSSVADEEDIVARKQFLAAPELDQRKDSVALSRAQEDELERAISDYMMWRSEGSPGEPSEQAWHSTVANATQNFYTQPAGQGRRMAIGVQNDEEDEWRSEIEKGLATPTPTSYSAYDPFGMAPPTLRRTDVNVRGHAQTQRSPRSPRFEEIPRPSGPMNGLRRGLGMVRRNM